MKSTNNERTPSVYFQFDDSHQKTSQSSISFDYSCSPEARKEQRIPFVIAEPLVPQRVQEAQRLPEQPFSKLKTEVFFEQFENNFVVVFDEEMNTSNPERLSLQSNISTKRDNLTSFSVNDALRVHQLTQSTEGLQSHVPREHKDKQDGQLDNETKQRKSPEQSRSSPLPEFNVKKRTEFKNIANLHGSKRQGFKLIKQGTVFPYQSKQRLASKSCLYWQKNASNLRTCVTRPKDKHVVLRPQRVNIFAHEHQHFRETLKSNTLDYWKKRFNMQKRDADRKHKVHLNIFQVSKCLRA